MVANEAREAGRPVMVAPVDGLVEQAAGAGVVVDFTDQAKIEDALCALLSASVKAIGKRARAAIHGCHEVREAQWSALLRSAQTKPRACGGRAALNVVTSRPSRSIP